MRTLWGHYQDTTRTIIRTLLRKSHVEKGLTSGRTWRFYTYVLEGSGCCFGPHRRDILRVKFDQICGFPLCVCQVWSVFTRLGPFFSVCVDWIRLVDFCLFFCQFMILRQQWNLSTKGKLSKQHLRSLSGDFEVRNSWNYVHHNIQA